jgi:hypothetical protein
LATIIRNISIAALLVILAINADAASFILGGIKHDISARTKNSGLVILSAASTQVQNFDGSSAQTVQLPAATALKTGYWYLINNQSSTTPISVLNGSSTPIHTIATSNHAYFYLSNASSSSGVWHPTTTITDGFLDFNSTQTATNKSFYSVGNIGIGTTSANQLLQVNDGASSSYTQYTNNTTGSTSTDGSLFGITSAGNTSIVQNESNLPIVLSTQTTEFMRIQSTGAVGIGTTSPSVDLHLHRPNPSVFRVSNTTSGISSNLAELGSDSSYSGYFRVRRDGSNEWFIYADPVLNVLNFTAGSLGGSQRVAMPFSGNGFFGLGTQSPSYTIGMGGDSARTIGLERRSGTTANGVNLTISAGGGAVTGTDRSGGSLILNSGTTTGSSATSSIVFNTPVPGASGTSDNPYETAMQITANRYVGIGTTTPIDKLHVWSAASTTLTNIVRLQNADTTNTGGSGVGLAFKVDSSVNSASYKSGIAFERTSSNARGTLHFLNNGSADTTSVTLANSAMAINLNGNVGIGTTSPGTRFHVSGTSTTFNVTSTGAVGVGTTSPSVNLDVVGDMALRVFTDSTTTGTVTALNSFNTSHINLTANTTLTIQGITNTANGKSLQLNNLTPNPMTIVNESASATAANRIRTGTNGNVTIATGNAATFRYDTPNSRWQLLIGSTGTTSSRTGAAWSGYHGDDCNAGTGYSSTSYGDMTADATCTLTEKNNEGMGTVTSALSGSDKLLGLVFTPPESGDYQICAFITNSVSASSGKGSVAWRLYDGTTEYVTTGHQSPTTSQDPWQTDSMCTVAQLSNSSQTFKVQPKVTGTGASVSVGGTSFWSAVVSWTIVKVNP